MLDAPAVDVPLVDGSVLMRGILDVEKSPEGLRLGRLPAWTKAQYPDPMTRAVVAMPSGCRLDLCTDSRSIAIELMITRIAMGGRDPYPAAVDLAVDGEIVGSAPVDGGAVIVVDPADPTRFRIERGDAVTVVFGDRDPVMKRVELWLPHNAMVELRAVRVDARASLGPPPPEVRPRWLHYGSSISHCMEASRPTGVWPAVAARLADVDLQSLGLGGSCHLDQFVARTVRDLPVDLISIKVGINVVNGDSMRERAFVPAVHGFLDTVRDGHPTAPLVVVSPIFCPAVEDHPGPTFADRDGRFVALDRPRGEWGGSLTLRRIRAILETVVAERRAAGDDRLHYLDGLDLFGPADAADLPDSLHPNDAGYARMGQRFFDLAFDKGGPLALS